MLRAQAGITAFQGTVKCTRAFVHPGVIVFNAFTGQLLYAMPIAGFKQRLGPLRTVTEQRIVAIEALQDSVRHRLWGQARAGHLLYLLMIAQKNHGWPAGPTVRQHWRSEERRVGTECRSRLSRTAK